MTITYQNGLSHEAILLSRSERAMRVIVRDSEDVLELRLISGVWVTEECEPVTVEFASRRPAGAPMKEEDFICSKDLAAHLIHLLMTDSSEDVDETPAVEPEVLTHAANRIA